MSTKWNTSENGKGRASRREEEAADREYIEGETGSDIAKIESEKDEPDKAQREPTTAPEEVHRRKSPHEPAKAS